MYYFICFLILINSSYAIDEVTKKRHLNTIAFIESTNGKNTNHKPIVNGIHRGDSAIGKYGIMPNTIRLILKKDKWLYKKYSFLLKYNNTVIKDFFNRHKNIEEEFASSLYDYYAKKYDQRIEYISCAWHYGEGKVIKSDNNTISNLPYVKRALAHYDKQN